MKTVLLTIFILLIANIGTAQIREDEGADFRSAGKTDHKFRDYSLSVSPGVQFHSYSKTQLYGGLKGRIFLTRRFSIDADLVFGKDYIHFGPGIFGLPLLAGLLKEGNNDSYDAEDDVLIDIDNTFIEILASVGLMIISIEHTAYHIPVNEKTDLSPYVSLLRFRTIPEVYYIEIESEVLRSQELSFALGLEYNIYYSGFMISPYLEYSRTYHGNISALAAGIYFGIYLPAKD